VTPFMSRLSVAEQVEPENQKGENPRSDRQGALMAKRNPVPGGNHPQPDNHQRWKESRRSKSET
jgi:hypothetical protein